MLEENVRREERGISLVGRSGMKRGRQRGGKAGEGKVAEMLSMGVFSPTIGAACDAEAAQRRGGTGIPT